ncbi:MAG: TatD family hydrolase [Maricaulaceae bacterium]|jgi:TatD DNase family protein
MLVDSHVNLHADAFADDVDAVIDRARAAGVARMVAICARLSDLPAVLAIADKHDDIVPTLGAHPHHAKDRPDITADELAETAKSAGAVAIGETGLDFHYNYSPEAEQRASFAAHIKAARRLDLPLVIHCRDADEAMADLLEELWEDGPFRMVLHSYTGGRDLARRAAALGAYFSVNGIASFKNAEDVRDVIRNIMPEDRIILETDAPYLAPVPHRGRRNEPAYLPHVAETLAEIKGWSVAETAERTTEAFFKLFDRTPPLRGRP